jgi:excisionase family DNA binding protein
MSEMATLPGFYTVCEAAKVIGVSHAQATRYISQGLLPAVDLGHQKLIEQSAVHTFQRPQRGNPNFRRENK